MLACGNGDRHRNTPADTATKPATPTAVVAQGKDDKTEIRDLVRNMLNWAESNKTFDFTPALIDKKDSLCIGFDLKKLDTNERVLKATNFFSKEFIDNYRQIILTLDKKARNKEFKWNTYELPPFNFANDSDPWCDCQDYPYDKPSPWDLVEVKVVSLDKEKGELAWTWGKLGADADQSWKDFSYKFKVQKEEGRWQISYLDGFDFKEGTKTI